MHKPRNSWTGFTLAKCLCFLDLPVNFSYEQLISVEAYTPSSFILKSSVMNTDEEPKASGQIGFRSWSRMDESSHLLFSSLLQSCPTIARQQRWLDRTAPCAAAFHAPLPRGPRRGVSPSGGLAPRGGRRSVDSRAFRSQSETRRRDGSSVNYHRPYLYFSFGPIIFFACLFVLGPWKYQGLLCGKTQRCFCFCGKGLGIPFLVVCPSIN